MTDPRLPIFGQALMHDVQSTAIKRIGYDHEHHCLLIEFQPNRVHVFLDVPVEVFRDLMRAESKGKYYNTYIRDLFDATLADLQPAPPPA